MIDHIVQNADLLHTILSFLQDDGNSVVRFALSSKELYDRILQQKLVDPDLWNQLVRRRWKRTRRRPGTNDASASGDDGTESHISSRELYIEKRRADAEAVRLLEEMTTDLLFELQFDNETIEHEGMLPSGDFRIGQAWEHHCWLPLLRNGADFYDVLKASARRYVGATTASWLHNRVFGFLAARCFQNIHFKDCLWEWKRLTDEEEEKQNDQLDRSVSQLNSARFLEQHALLVCEIQKSPLELLEHQTPCDLTNSHDDGYEQGSLLSIMQCTHWATKTLDRIADICRERMNKKLEGNTSRTAKLQIVNDVLVNHYGFSGNSEDYYNYRNVLLGEVLESKKGMPLTLCVVYSSVCRRLDIPVQLIGLPGHVVLGFDVDDDSIGNIERRSFIDVFRGGRILSMDDCRRMVAMYGILWREEYLAPISTRMAMQRIFNNLRNCHEKAMMRTKTPVFCSDLMIQQETLGMMYRYPPDVSGPLVERVATDLPIVLSPDLLRAYNLVQ